jgi:hypothetical protein
MHTDFDGWIWRSEMAGDMVRRTHTAESLANVRRPDTLLIEFEWTMLLERWTMAMAMAVDMLFVAVCSG